MAAHRPDEIRAFFDRIGAAEWDRFDRSPVEKIKLHLHELYLRRHVPAGARVLEIGAGPGRFTRVLVDHGCRVVVTDLSPVQLELNRATAARLGFAAGVDAWREADICDLAAFPDASFDALVAYGGPLSYVFDGRGGALDECRRVLVRGGTLALSVMSLWGTVHATLPQVLGLPAEANAAIMASGDLTRELLPQAAHQCHMFRSDELRALLEEHGLAVTAMSASNSLVTGWETSLAEVEGSAVWPSLLAAEEESSRQPGCLDAGTHIIAVATSGRA